MLNQNEISTRMQNVHKAMNTIYSAVKRMHLLLEFSADKNEGTNPLEA